jgi:MFS family permease
MEGGAEALRYDLEAEKKERKYGPRYKWVVLSNTTLGGLMFAIDSSIVLISLPAIFSGLGVNPLVPSNIGLLLWTLLGYLIVSSVFVVTIGRLADSYGRVRLYNIGFIVFAIASTLIYASTYLVHGVAGAESLIALRLIQAVGGAFLFANSAALITDAFPHNERGMALGINSIAFAGGSAAGLLIGGVLAAIDWHLIFLISVPVGVLGAIWSYIALHEIAALKKDRKLDIPGNVVFALGIGILLVSMTYALLPYGNSQIGWSNPAVYGGIILGAALLVLFVILESRTEDPMFRLDLFRNNGYSMGILSLFLAGSARWGLEFILIIWLQGIWLPMHGIDFLQTPLYASYYLLPLTIGFIALGPVSGKLSDKYGPRLLSTAGMLINVVGFLVLLTFPVNFKVIDFILLTFTIGVGQGLFLSPNIASIMNSIPPEYRGVGSGMRSTIMQVSMMFSIIIFFSLLIVGLSGSLGPSIHSGLIAQGLSNSTAESISKIPPTSALFASFLGYNPMKTLIPGQILGNLTAQQQANITSTSFFPKLISPSFTQGLKEVLYFAAGMSLVAAIASALRNKNPIYKN